MGGGEGGSIWFCPFEQAAVLAPRRTTRKEAIRIGRVLRLGESNRNAPGHWAWYVFRFGIVVGSRFRPRRAARRRPPLMRSVCAYDDGTNPLPTLGPMPASRPRLRRGAWPPGD